MTLAIFVQGCGTATEPAIDASASDAALGGFVVTLVPAAQDAPAYTSVQGKVYGGAMPSAVVWTAVEEAGGCRVLTPRVPFCATPCGGEAVCVEDGRCAPYPAPHNLGRVRVAGLGAAAFEMQPVGGSYQPDSGVALPYPPFREGGLVQVAAPGGALGALAIDSRGITPLVFDQTPAPRSGQPLPLAWTPPGQPDASRIEVKLDISHHGGAKGTIECDVPDTGALEIPASQVSRLLALGAAGFPTIVVRRVAAGTTAVRAGLISLRVVSAVERPVEIEGLRSCTEHSQCPAGQVCRSDLTCQ